MVLAGKSQDRLGPRITALIGGALVGLGFCWVSRTTSYWAWVAGFGVLTGAGLAFGYAAATPPALKWYPHHRTGLVAGIVVSGFGLASVYIAPLSTALLEQHGLGGTMLCLGIAFFVVVALFSRLLENPPAGHLPRGTIERRSGSDSNRQQRVGFPDRNETPATLLRNRQFWLLWLLYFIGAGAGLMVIGNVAQMAKQSLGARAFQAVAILAIGNAVGRIVAGVASDQLGRRRTLQIMFAAQALLMLISTSVVRAGGGGPAAIVLVATLIGFCYGANLALFPSFAKDLWGIKGFGVNYGILFTAWGIGGFCMSRLAETLKARTGSLTASFIVAFVLLAGGVGLAGFIEDKKQIARREQRRLQAAQAGDATAETAASAEPAPAPGPVRRATSSEA